MTNADDLDGLLDRIGAAASGPDDDPQGLSQLLRAHLDRSPGDRRVLAEAVETSGTAVDWRTVNADRAEGLAILYAFTPWNATSGLVAARRTRERGEVMDVVCHTLDGASEKDPTSNLIADPWIAEQRVVGSTPDLVSWEGVTRFSRQVFDELRASGRAGTYRSLYSRAYYAASHIAAAQYKIRHPEVRWTAEMSDPLSRLVTGEPRVTRMEPSPVVKELRGGLRAAGADASTKGLRLFEWVERMPYALADEIIFTNAHQLEFMLGYCEDPALAARVRSIATIAPHPTPPRHLYDVETTDYALDPDRVNLGYFGVFHPNRGLTEVTDALARLEPSVRDRVRLHVFTTGPDAIREQVVAAGLDDVVVVNGYLPYLGFLHVATRLDVLIVNDADMAHVGTNPYLPSKVSDYRGSGTPVWAVYEEGSVLSGLEVEHRTALGDVDAAVAVLSGLR